MENDFRYIHEVILDKLEFDQYTYYVDPGPNGTILSYNFNVYNWEKELFNNFVVYGDLGTANSQCLPAIEKRLKNEKVDLIWHVGDVCYDLYEHDGKAADDWMNKMEPVAAEYPYMVIPGNHEAKFNFSHYESRYNSVSPTNPYYYRNS